LHGDIHGAFLGASPWQPFRSTSFYWHFNEKCDSCKCFGKFNPCL